ncbi:MAG: M48 family metalloprotease [Rhodospirillales bacterium]
MLRVLALLISVVAAASQLAACSTNPATGASSFTGFMSREDELRIGREEHPKIVAQFGGEYADPALRDYVTRVGKALAARSEMPELDWRFTVLNSDIVNAFALPGGFVYTTRGLVALASSEAELAGVLGHEIGHVTARHSAQRYSSAMLAQAGTVAATILGGVLLGSDGAQLAQTAVGSGAQLGLAGYSREQELEADDLGIRYLGRAIYDPGAMAQFLEKLQRETALQAELAGRPGAADEFSLLQSHPRTPDRVRRAIQEAGEAGRPADPRVRREEYLRAIDGLAWGGDARNGFVKNAVFVHPELRFRFEVPAGFRIMNSDSAVVAMGPDNVRIVFDRDPRAPAADLAAYLRRRGAEGVESTTAGGMPAATGGGRIRTQGGQVLDVREFLIAGERTVWRFRFLSPPQVTARHAPEMRRTAFSFRALSAQEAAAERPFRIAILRAERDDTAETLARRMAVRDAALRRFQVMNGLRPGEALQPGQSYKIIAE